MPRAPKPLSASKDRQLPLFPRIINISTAATILGVGYSLCPIILFANAQSTSTSGNSGTSSVYVYVNDTTQWTTQGNWTIETASRGFQSNWLIGSRPEGSTTPTTISLTFNGVAVVVFGTVVDGVQNQSMNVTVKFDDESSLEPTYAPISPTNGMDINYQLFNKGPLDGSTVHTLVIEITGETSPFWLQGVVYNPVSPGSATTSSAASSMTATGSSSDSSASNETAKLGGAIGGGIGALILVALVIWFMMRRIRRLEDKERTLQATPFFLRNGPPAGSTTQLGTGSRVNLAAIGTRTDPSGGKGQNSAFSSKQDLRQGGRASAQSWNNYEKRGNTSNKDLTSSSVRKGDSERRSNSISRNPDPYTSSSRSRSQSQSYTSPASRHTSNINSASPPVHNSVYSSPSASHISLPSEYQATTVGNGLGTAVASSYIGTSPLPDVWDPDAPPVPALPANVSAKNGADHKDGKRKSSKSAKSSKSRKQSHSAHPTSPSSTDPLSAGLGLFSPTKNKSDAENPNNSTTSLSRPLPIVPGTRSSAPTYSFPPEKVGLSPPPPKRRGSKDSIRKKPLPLGDNERERRDRADKTDTPTTMQTNTVTTPSYTTHNTNTTSSIYYSPPPPHTPPTR